MKTVRHYELRIRRDRVAESTQPYNEPISGPDKVLAAAKYLLHDAAEERFLVFYLDIQTKLIGYSEVAKGGLDSCPVSPSGVFRGALVVGASSVIVVHNHPSGSSRPSSEDEAITHRLWDAGKLLGVPLLDHVIIADQSTFSFAQKGWV